MIVYSATKQQFLDVCDNNDIEEVILKHFKEATGKKVAASEIRSWQGSLTYMAKVLRDKDLPEDAGVAIELHIPQSMKRIDFLLTGHDQHQGKNAVLVELKQWSKASATSKDAIVKTALGGSHVETIHPSYQVWSYATLLEGFNEAVYDQGIKVHPCAYLHNYVSDGVINSAHYDAYTSKAPLFLKGPDELTKLRSFLKQHIYYGDNQEVLYELSSGKSRPSKALAEALTGLMEGKPEFVLIDDQKTVFESVLAAVAEASADAPKVLIIEGGPGTGKTVVAINLLVRLTALRLMSRYVSKNAAPRAVYEKKLVGTVKPTKFSSLFSGSGAYTEIKPDFYDALIIDEAHRLNEKSGFYGNEGENQIKELIGSAKCSVFFIDEDQRA